jgi:YD repeat-containing protein
MAYGGTGTTYSYRDAQCSSSVTVTDPLGRHTTVTENCRGQPVSIIDLLNHTTNITYDGVGNVSSVTDPAGNMTSFTPDPDGVGTRCPNDKKESDIPGWRDAQNLYLSSSILPLSPFASGSIPPASTTCLLP